MQNPNYFDHVPGAELMDLQTCVIQYKESKNENLLRIILFKLRPTFNYYLYTKTNYPDKSELLALYEDKLLECIKNFDDSKNVKFLTFFSRCLDNALINFINANRKNDLSLDFEYSEDEEEQSSMYNFLMKSEDADLRDLEAQLLLESIKGYLDPNEYAVCKILLAENHKLKYWEIAQEMGLTIAAIPNILKRLRKKFNSGIFSENFAKSL